MTEKPQADADDEPSVMGHGCVSPPPTHGEATAAWRRAFAARLVGLGVLNQEGADACAAATDVDLSENPSDAADEEVSYWDAE